MVQFMSTEASLDVIDLLKKLVSFNTVNPPGTNQECPGFIEDYLKSNTGANIRKVRTDDVVNVIASVKFSNSGPHLVFNGHWDVVPVFREKWRTDPFIPVINGDWLYGRGSADMKSGLAALIKTFELLSQQEDLQGTLTLMAVGDEERGGHRGTQAVLNAMPNLNPSLVLIGEPTELRVKVGRRGIIHVKLSIETNSYHSAWLYRKYISSIEICSALVLRLRNMNLNDSIDIMPHTTFAVTRFNAGIAINVLPKICNLSIDVRNTPKTNGERVKAILTKILDDLKNEFGDFHYELTVKEKAQPYFIGNDYIKSLVESIYHKLGLPIVYDAGGGASDGRYFVTKGVKNIVEIGPKAKNVHGENEAVNIPSVYKVLSIYKMLGKYYLSS